MITVDLKRGNKGSSTYDTIGFTTLATIGHPRSILKTHSTLHVTVCLWVFCRCRKLSISAQKQASSRTQKQASSRTVTWRQKLKSLDDLILPWFNRNMTLIPHRISPQKHIVHSSKRPSFGVFQRV